MDRIRIALIGYGKIAIDQHIPAIAANPDFDLVAVVSARGSGPAGVAVFTDMAALLASDVDFSATTHCNTPIARRDSVLAAIAAGKHVLLEKPPTASLSEWNIVAAAALHQPISLMTAWHSQANAAVVAAQAWLTNRRIDNVTINWREDVRKWHPDQDWIWQVGGFGVFDPGINALSIATRILPFSPWLTKAELDVPENRTMPIAATLRFAGAGLHGAMIAHFDWRETDGECWQITVTTDAGTMVLHDGGTRLEIDGVTTIAHGNDEYPTLYREFAALVRAGASHADIAPLRLVADAFLLGERRSVAAHI